MKAAADVNAPASALLRRSVSGFGRWVCEIGRLDTVRAVTPSSCVIVGVDTSAESVVALEWAMMLAAGLRCRVVAVHAVGLLEEGGYRPHPDMRGLIDDARDHVPLARGIAVEGIVEDGPAADVIVRVAKREGADLIVVGNRGHGQASRLLGSTSEALLALAVLPILVVPGPTLDVMQ